jgi:hypothetical protein
LGGEKNPVQEIGSIMTYFRRYSWASNLGLYADEDDDGNSAPKGVSGSRGVSTPHQPPKNASQGTPEAPKAIPEEANQAKWGKVRLKFLNKLEGAPGQKNRELIVSYFSNRGWITGNQTPEDLPVFVIPTDAPAMDAFLNDLQAFDAERHKPAEAPGDSSFEKDKDK